jgi:hypothetical protein
VRGSHFVGIQTEADRGDIWHLVVTLCVFVVCVFVVRCICCTVCCVFVVLCVVYLLYYEFDVFPLDAGLLARGQYSEGPALAGHLDTGFSWFSRVFKQMLSWFPRLQVATTCFSCSPPDVNFSSKPVSCFVYVLNDHCHRVTTQLQLIWYEHVPKSVETSRGGKVIILWNQQIQTDRTIPQ